MSINGENVEKTAHERSDGRGRNFTSCSSFRFHRSTNLDSRGKKFDLSGRKDFLSESNAGSSDSIDHQTAGLLDSDHSHRALVHHPSDDRFSRRDFSSSILFSFVRKILSTEQTAAILPRRLVRIGQKMANQSEIFEHRRKSRSRLFWRRLSRRIETSRAAGRRSRGESSSR